MVRLGSFLPDTPQALTASNSSISCMGTLTDCWSCDTLRECTLIAHTLHSTQYNGTACSSSTRNRTVHKSVPEKHNTYSLHNRVYMVTLEVTKGMSPSQLQTTEASFASHVSLQMVPHWPPMQYSTRPSSMEGPPTRRTWPSVQTSKPLVLHIKNILTLYICNDCLLV